MPKTLADPLIQPGTLTRVPVHMIVRVVTWRELSRGDRVWYLIPDGRGLVDPDAVIGPFTVADPAVRRLRNQNGVELCVGARLVMLVREPYSELY